MIREQKLEVVRAGNDLLDKWIKQVVQRLSALDTIRMLFGVELEVKLDGLGSPQYIAHPLRRKPVGIVVTKHGWPTGAFFEGPHSSTHIKITSSAATPLTLWVY